MLIFIHTSISFDCRKDRGSLQLSRSLCTFQTYTSTERPRIIIDTLLIRPDLAFISHYPPRKF